MAKFSFTSVALKWYFFSCESSVALYSEYFNLFMKQLGFNPAEIGFTTLLGLPILFIPLCLLFSEKLQARKATAIFGTIGVLVCCVLPLFALIFPALQPRCNPETLIMDISRSSYGSVRSKYANNTNNLSASIFHNSSSYSTLTNTLALATAPSNDSLHPTTTTHPPSTIDQTPGPSKTNDTIPNLTSIKFTRIDHLLFNNSPTYIGNTHSFASKIKQPVMSSSPTHRSYKNDRHHSSLSVLLVILTLSRSMIVFFECMTQALVNLATITYLENERESYGGYLMWTPIGSAFSISFVAMLAWFIRIHICGTENYGYFMAFIWGSFLTFLSLLSLPWFKFKYNEKKSFSWSGVTSDVCNLHYIVMFFLQFYTGLCVAFQIYWELWYLDGLSASPLLIGGAVLIRRPLVAISTFVSCHLIRKIGDLKTVCVALFLYSFSFLALSFTRTPWLVLAIDTCQALAFGLSYCAFTVIFSKAGADENASMILGR